MKQRMKKGPVRSKDHMALELQSAVIVAAVNYSSPPRSAVSESTELGAGNGTRLGFRSQISIRRGRQSNGAPDAQKALLILFSLAYRQNPDFYLSLHPRTFTTFLLAQRLSTMEDEVAALVSSSSYRMKSPP